MTVPDNIENLIRSDLKHLESYQAIEPIDVLSRKSEISSQDVIKLDGNENPYGCSPKVQKALSVYPYFHIYPDPEQRELRDVLSKYVGVMPRNIVAGAGCDELIDLVLRLFINPGDKVINLPSTFGMYPFCTEVCGGKILNIPRKPDFSIDIPSVIQALDHKTKVIFIASPNNPSGNLTLESEILQLLDTDTIVVVDEAYAEFSGVTVSSLVDKHSNLVVLRTFSKWAGIAGLRMGYGIFPVNMVGYLMKIKQPYNVNVAAQVAAIESLNDFNYLQSTIKLIVDERERLREKLNEISWIKTYPSKANFILCLISNGKASEIHQLLQRKGIFVRYFDNPDLKDCLRISVGKPEHTDKLITLLREID
jgi:histidinol-phosphate aminotransferase